MSDKVYRILMICHGNICRSPMAEFIMKHMAEATGLSDRIHAESAAVSDEECGNPIYPPAKRCLERHGIPYDPEKRARRVTISDYSGFDILVCMDASNVRLLRRIIGDDTEKKTRLLMSYVGENRDVADPWYTGDFEKTYADVTEGCRAMLESIENNINP